MTPTTRAMTEKANMAEDKKPAIAGASLESVGQLPPDVRQEIWRAACSMPTSTPGVCFFSVAEHRPRQEPHLIVHEPRNRDVLGTNTEAHDVSLMSDGPTRAYNPDVDILYVTDDAFYNFTNHECNLEGPEWVTKIRHLAIGLSTSNREPDLRRMLARLFSLETLSVVFQGPSGKFDFMAPIKAPAGKDTPLRRLTKRELGNVTVNAKYNYDTWAGAFPVHWTHSGPRHMDTVEEIVNEACCPENAYHWLTPLWDDKTRRVGIRYEAKCFEPLPARERFHQ